MELWPGDRVGVALFVGSTVALFGEEAGLSQYEWFRLSDRHLQCGLGKRWNFGLGTG